MRRLLHFRIGCLVLVTSENVAVISPKTILSSACLICYSIQKPNSTHRPCLYSPADKVFQVFF